MNLKPSLSDLENINLTLDDFLGGDLKLWQPRVGYRIGIDTILLAATIPALAGDKVLEVGAGSGGAALALAKRVKGLTVLGFELQATMAELARKNCTKNGMEDYVEIIEGCITSPPSDLVPGSFDHVMANPLI
jgi:tRNA1(Val) A37 N6-methylase TrmN6